MECSAISCNHFTCGGIGHHKDCVRYPESMQNMIDDKNARIKELEKALTESLNELRRYEKTAGKMPYTKCRRKYLKLLTQK